MLDFRRVAAAAALVCAMPLASAAVLNFDDLGGLGFFTSNYNGFKFGTNSASDNAFFHTTQVSSFYTPHSGTGYVSTDFQLYDNTNAYQGTTAASLSGSQQLITNTTPFQFSGAWFTGSDTVGYKLYVGSSAVFMSAPSAALTNMPIFVSSGFAGFITGVEVFGRQGFYAMDDFTFNPVPEPATYALMFVGLLGVATTARYRNRNS